MDVPQITRQTTPHRAVRREIATERGRFAALDTAPDGDAGMIVLLVPGYTGSKEDFAPLLNLLADAGPRVVAIDQRGQYQSPGTDDPGAYTVHELGADLVAVARTLGPSVHLVGHSFGGLVARAAVLADPSAFASLTLMSSGPGELPAGPRRAVIEAAEPHLHDMGLERIYDAGQQALAKDPTWQPAPEPLRSFLRQRFVSGSAHALQHMGRTMLTEPDRVADLRATGVPTLVVYGRDDNAWSPEAQSDMALRLGAREVIIDDALHSPAIENPPATARALLAFWETAPPAS
ncbi:alpha/beta fold hydrolase [Cumulibacter manganitolerans]|uniref:alpha/beta fold hydrolase n=1 Tax=Cumulibacter manganitolerans TaxID=1884992 RepID=UPI001E61EE48|nr:alpha/beta hydrolase [Cumulibacter manganitolerans]